MATGREVLFDLLRWLEMTKIFGNVGSTEEPHVAELSRGLQYILALQGSVAIAMADAFRPYSVAL